MNAIGIFCGTILAVRLSRGQFNIDVMNTLRSAASKFLTLSRCHCIKIGGLSKWTLFRAGVLGCMEALQGTMQDEQRATATFLLAWIRHIMTPLQIAFLLVQVCSLRACCWYGNAACDVQLLHVAKTSPALRLSAAGLHLLT